MKKIKFIINPKSGVGVNRLTVEKVYQFLDKQAFQVSVAYTEYAGHAAELAKQAVADSYDIVVAGGGDGSANEVASSLMNTNTALGILPMGSGNGFARHLKIPLQRAKAIKLFNNYKLITTDMGLANERPFINVAGMGYDADVAGHFDTTRLRGLLSYAYSALKIFFKYQPTTYEVYVDGDRLFNRKTYFITAAIGAQYGYNFEIAPLAKVDDGKFDLVVLNRFWKGFAPLIVILGKLKLAHKTRFADMHRCRRITIKAQSPSYMQIDGEPIGQQQDLVMEVVPAALKVAVPAS